MATQAQHHVSAAEQQSEWNQFVGQLTADGDLSQLPHDKQSPIGHAPVPKVPSQSPSLEQAGNEFLRALADATGDPAYGPRQQGDAVDEHHGWPAAERDLAQSPDERSTVGYEAHQRPSLSPDLKKARDDFLNLLDDATGYAADRKWPL